MKKWDRCITERRREADENERPMEKNTRKLRTREKNEENCTGRKTDMVEQCVKKNQGKLKAI